MTLKPEVWGGVLRRIQEKLPEFAFDTWISPLVLHRTATDRLVVMCPSAFHRDHVRNSFHGLIAEGVHAETGQLTQLDFDVAASDAQTRVVATGANASPTSSEASSHGARRQRTADMPNRSEALGARSPKTKSVARKSVV